MHCIVSKLVGAALFLPVLALHRSILLVFISCLGVQVESIEIASDPGMDDKVGTTSSREVGQH